MSFEPAVYAGAPQDTDSYNKMEANGLGVYVPKDAVVADDGMEINIAGQSFWKRLVVKGLEG